MQAFVSFLVLLTLTLVSPPLKAQTTHVSRVEDALARGDVQALAGFCADRVDVAIGGNATTYSRAQVRYVLADFVEANPPEGFRFEQTMGSNEDAELASGTYHTEGKAYQVMARFGKRDGAWELRELRIDG